MGLKEYYRKRDFAITPEPRGEEKKKEGRSFVIQKHAATGIRRSRACAETRRRRRS